MVRTRVAAALVVTLLAVTACGPGAPTGSRTAEEPTTTASTGHRLSLVPGLVGLPLAHAEAHLGRSALALGAVGKGDDPCLPLGQVLEQDPETDARLRPGDTVDVVVNEPTGECGGELPPAAPDLQRVADAFLRFAAGEIDHPPADTPIGLHLGGHLVTTLATSEIGDRRAWRICPEGGSYAARLCPFSAVEILDAHRRQVVATAQRPQHPCAHPSRPRVGGRSVTLTPREPQACTSYFAVVLHVNDVGQVTDVDLVWAEP
jgi:PASTA domain-containing protein